RRSDGAEGDGWNDEWIVRLAVDDRRDRGHASFAARHLNFDTRVRKRRAAALREQRIELQQLTGFDRLRRAENLRAERIERVHDDVRRLACCFSDVDVRSERVRYAICCRLRIADELPMKLVNGMAGMNCPSVPPVATLYVRLVTAVFFVIASLVITRPAGSSCCTSRMPFDESPSEPIPNQLRTMSSSAIVTPPSMLTVVTFSGIATSPVPVLSD